MSDFTFLTEEQIFGSNKLDVIKKRGAKAEMSDFSALLLEEGIGDAAGIYYTKSTNANHDAHVRGFS